MYGMSGRGTKSISTAGADALAKSSSASGKRKRQTDTSSGDDQKVKGEGVNSKRARRIKNKKARRQHYRPPPAADPAALPRFLDSTGAVTAGTFSARRLPEMKSLWRSYLKSRHAEAAVGAGGASASGAAASAAASRLDDSWNYRSGGRKASDRHLRRRTGSHHRRRRHRFPRGFPADNDIRKGEDGGAGGVDDTIDTGGDIKMPCRRARRKAAVLREAHRGWQTQPSSKASSSSSSQP